MNVYQMIIYEKAVEKKKKKIKKGSFKENCKNTTKPYIQVLNLHDPRHVCKV